jgi:hypothetical protein
MQGLYFLDCGSKKYKYVANMYTVLFIKFTVFLAADSTGSGSVDIPWKAGV